MGHPPRIASERTDQEFFMLLTPSEYIELQTCSKELGESMAEYVRKAIAQRYNLENPNRLPFGVRWRKAHLPRLRKRS